MKWKTRNSIIAITCIILIVPVIFGLSFFNTSKMNHPEQNNNYGTDNLAIKISLKIYKNGRLVYYDPDDPPVVQLFRSIAEMLGASNYIDSDMSYKGWFTDEPYSFIVLVNSNTLYSKGLTYSQISSNVIKSDSIKQQDIGYFVKTGDLVLVLTKSIIINSQTKIYGTGLVLHAREYWYYYGEHNAYHDLLLLYDYLNTAIDVNVGDVVTVVYEIHLPVSSEYSG